jgi:hypothetical protein
MSLGSLRISTDKWLIFRAHPEIRFGCDFDFSAATASDFTKSPQRSTLATFAGFLLIVLVSLENPKSRFQNEFPDVPFIDRGCGSSR